MFCKGGNVEDISFRYVPHFLPMSHKYPSRRTDSSFRTPRKGYLQKGNRKCDFPSGNMFPTLSPVQNYGRFTASGVKNCDCCIRRSLHHDDVSSFSSDTVPFRQNFSTFGTYHKRTLFTPGKTRSSVKFIFPHLARRKLTKIVEDARWQNASAPIQGAVFLCRQLNSDKFVLVKSKARKLSLP